LYQLSIREKAPLEKKYIGGGWTQNLQMLKCSSLFDLCDLRSEVRSVVGFLKVFRVFVTGLVRNRVPLYGTILPKFQQTKLNVILVPSHYLLRVGQPPI
jgi:hypothetical protein